MTDSLHARWLRPEDAQAICELWRTVLPGTVDTSRWFEDTVSDLLKRGAVSGTGIFDAVQGGTCLAFGLSCFLREEMTDSYIENPEPYLNLRLLKSAHKGNYQDFLMPDQIALPNAGEGLDLFVLEWCQITFDFEDPLAHRLLNLIVPHYIAQHASYRLRRSLHETEIALGYIQESGSNKHLFDVRPQHPWSMSEDGRGPRAVYGLTREEALKLPGVGVAKTVFEYVEPKFRFRKRERQILLAALDGQTDVAIAGQLGISRDGVRNHWRAIYDHVADISPEILGLTAAEPSNARGAEKRRRLLAHLSGALQELRPYGKERRAKRVSLL